MELDFFIYILRHAWFWLIEFWIRPLTVRDRFEKNGWIEFFLAIVGSGLWGALMGTILWLINGNIQSIWMTFETEGIMKGMFVVAFVFAVAAMVAFAGAFAVVITFAVVVAFARAVAFVEMGTVALTGTVTFMETGTVVFVFAAAIAAAFAVATAVAGVGTGVFAFAVAFTVVAAVVAAIAVAVVGAEVRTGVFAVAIAIAVVEVFSQLRVGAGTFTATFVVAIVVAVAGAGVGTGAVAATKTVPGVVAGTIAGFITWFIGLPLVFFLRTPIEQILIWGMILVFSLGVGMTVGFLFNDEYGLYFSKKNGHLKRKKNSQVNFLSIFYSLFLVVALGLWLTTFVMPDDFNQKLNILVLFMIITPALATGLLFYPFVVFEALWQYRNPKHFTPQKLHSTIAFRWQSFAYPLPQLRYYLFRIAKKQNIKTAIDAIQQVQLWTLQMAASRQAAQDLACHPETALPFCHEIASQTNNATLLPLSTTGAIGRAIAILAKPQEKEGEQPLRLWINEFPPKVSQFKESSHQNDWLPDFQEIRSAALSTRLKYAQQQLVDCQNYKGITDYQSLLENFQHYTQIDNLDEILSIVEQPLPIHENPEWLQGGWGILQQFNQQWPELQNYRQSNSPDTRQQHLTHFQNKLKALEWQNWPDYWANLGRELAADWIEILEKAKARVIFCSGT